MALSYCSSLSQQDYLTQTELSAATDDKLLYFNDNFNYLSSDNFINPLLEFDESLFYPSEDTFSTNLLPVCSSPKCQKSYFEDYNSFDALQIPDQVPRFDAFQIPAQVPKFEAPAAGFCEGRSNESVMKKQSGSAQSIAARERRRKITEKTQELGKLIPGGNKMNTAQMLHSAFNYVKFLQAQLHLLQLMNQFDDKENQFHTNELQVLVASPKIQEKLYSEEKCLVPVEFLRNLANHNEIQPIDEIHLLLGNNC